MQRRSVIKLSENFPRKWKETSSGLVIKGGKLGSILLVYTLLLATFYELFLTEDFPPSEAIWDRRCFYYSHSASTLSHIIPFYSLLFSSILLSLSWKFNPLFATISVTPPFYLLWGLLPSSSYDHPYLFSSSFLILPSSIFGRCPNHFVIFWCDFSGCLSTATALSYFTF